MGYSGGALVLREGVPHLIYYTYATDYPFSATINIAYAADDDLKVWKKSENNPVLRDETPKEWNRKNIFLIPARYTVFDPDAWYEKTADAYYMISSGTKPALFKSRDMRTWSYPGDLIDKKNTMRNPNEDPSCPDSFHSGMASICCCLLAITGELSTSSEPSETINSTLSSTPE